jgi:hypothetical protein
LLPALWSLEVKVATASPTNIAASTISFSIADFGVAGVQQQQQQRWQQQPLFVSCDAAAAAASLPCAAFKWDPVSSALGYFVSIVSAAEPLLPSSTPFVPFSSIYIRHASAAVHLSAVNLSSIRPLFISVTPHFRNAIGGSLFVSCKPQNLNVSLASSDRSLILLSFQSPIECDLYLYMLRPASSPFRIATLQSGGKVFVVRLNSPNGPENPCTDTAFCAMFQLQLSVCYAVTTSMQSAYFTPPSKSAYLPWSIPYTVGIAVNFSRDMISAGGGALYINAEPFSWFEETGSSSSQAWPSDCQIQSYASVNISRRISSSSSSMFRPRLFVASTSFVSATVCVMTTSPCNVSSCSMTVAATSAPLVERNYRDGNWVHSSHAGSSGVLPSAADVDMNADVRAEWTVSITCIPTPIVPD